MDVRAKDASGKCFFNEKRELFMFDINRTLSHIETLKRRSALFSCKWKNPFHSFRGLSSHFKLLFEPLRNIEFNSQNRKLRIFMRGTLFNVATLYALPTLTGFESLCHSFSRLSLRCQPPKKSIFNLKRCLDSGKKPLFAWYSDRVL